MASVYLGNNKLYEHGDAELSLDHHTATELTASDLCEGFQSQFSL